MNPSFKIGFVSLFLFLLLTKIAFPQWSTDPNNNLIVGYGLDPHICSDSAGGAYITYDYNSTSYPRWLALERLDKYGYKPWGTLKQILGESPQQYRAKIIEDGEGGAIISYIDRYENLPNWTQRVRVQRVDSSGNFLWGQTGIRVTLNTINQGDHHLVTDGNGGCVIAWQDVQYIYYINRIDRDGNKIWGDNGITLNTGGANAQPIIVKAADGNYYLQAGTIIYRINHNGEILNQFSSTILGQPVPDPEGGVVVSGFIGNIYNRKLVSQRKDSLGNNFWQEPYVEIADSLDIGTSLNMLSNNNYYYYGWLGRKNGIAEILQIQGLRNDGSKLFFESSIPLNESSSSVTSILIISSYYGSNIYAWTHWDSPQTYNANFARRIDSTGTDLWQINPVLLNEPYLGYFSMTTDCAGGAVGVGYMNSDFAIRALKVSLNGNLGEVISGIENASEEVTPVETILFQNYPNPFNPTTKIKYSISSVGTRDRVSVQIIIYDLLGNKVATLVNEEKPAGEYSVEFTVGQDSSPDIASGIYFYQLKVYPADGGAGQYSETKKMILLK